MDYIINYNNKVEIDGKIIINNDDICKAIEFCNKAIKKLYEQTQEFDINIFEILGMRNLSGMVGEYFAKSIQRFSNDKLHSNLHQDGYPDLLLTDTYESLNYFKSLYIEKDNKKYPKDKSLFSPYMYRRN